MIGMKRRVDSVRSEKGYLLLSTIFLLILSSVMMQGMISISRNHIIQLNQLSTSYQAKAALHTAEMNVKTELAKNKGKLESGEINSSVGKIQVMKKTNQIYELQLITKSGERFTKQLQIKSIINSESEIEKDEAQAEKD